MRMIAVKEAPDNRDNTGSSFSHVEAAVIEGERGEIIPPDEVRGQRPALPFFLFAVTRFRGGWLEKTRRFDAVPPSRLRFFSGTRNKL